MQRVVVIYYGRFDTTYRFHPHGSGIQKKVCSPNRDFIWRRAWVAQSLSSVLSANSVDVSGWMEGCVVVSAAWREMLRDRRNSNRCDSEKQENIHMTKVGGRRIFTARSPPCIKSVLGQRAEPLGYRPAPRVQGP